MKHEASIPFIIAIGFIITWIGLPCLIVFVNTIQEGLVKAITYSITVGFCLSLFFTIPFCIQIYKEIRTSNNK